MFKKKKSKLKKPVYRSRTTRNVAVGSLSTAGIVAWLIAAARTHGWAPWPEDWDIGVAGAIVGTVIPFVTRLIAGLFDQPQTRLRGPRNASLPLLLFAGALCGLLGASGCATTTTSPDGTVVVSGVDSDAVAAIVAAVSGCDMQLAQDIADAYISVREAEGRIERQAALDRMDALAEGLDGVLAMFRRGRLALE